MFFWSKALGEGLVSVNFLIRELSRFMSGGRLEVAHGHPKVIPIDRWTLKNNDVKIFN